MKLLQKLAKLSPAALALIVGCASGPDPVDTPGVRGQEAVAQIDTNLKRLRDLQVFEVGRLITHAPESALQCYSLPCDDEDRRIVEPFVIAAAEKLATFTGRAMQVEAATENPAEREIQCSPSAIDANLERLNGLGIVEVSGLMRVEAMASPNCYNLACPDDVQRAEQATCDRAVTLAKIVEATKDMK